MKNKKKKEVRKELRELAKILREASTRLEALSKEIDQNRPLDRAQHDARAMFASFAQSVGQAAGYLEISEKLTFRPQTEVELFRKLDGKVFKHVRNFASEESAKEYVRDYHPFFNVGEWAQTPEGESLVDYAGCTYLIVPKKEED